MDGRGNIYVNGSVFDVRGGGKIKPGIIALVTPDGSVRQVADDIAFPNGMVVTPDNSTLIIAESFANRLTAFDIAADGSLSNRRVWAEVHGVPMESASTPKAPSGSDPNKQLPAYPRRWPGAADGSTSTAVASLACSAARTGRPFSCSRPT